MDIEFHNIPCDMNHVSYMVSPLTLQTQKSLYRKHHDTANGLIRVWFGLRQIMNATDRLLIETRDIAKELKTGIHMVHIHILCIKFSFMFLFKASSISY